MVKDVTETDTALKLIEQAEHNLEKVRDMANRQYSESDCPIKEDHYKRSSLLFGQERYIWTCGFCGKEEQA